MEGVFELRLEHRAPGRVERPRDALGAAALAGRDHHAEPAVRIGLRGRAAERRGRRDSGGGGKAADKAAARHDNGLPDMAFLPKSCLPAGPRCWRSCVPSAGAPLRAPVRHFASAGSAAPSRDGGRQIPDLRIHLFRKQRHAAHRALVVEVAGLLHHHQVVEAADLIVELADARRHLVRRAGDQDALLHHVVEALRAHRLGAAAELALQRLAR